MNPSVVIFIVIVIVSIYEPLGSNCGGGVAHSKLSLMPNCFYKLPLQSALKHHSFLKPKSTAKVNALNVFET